MNRLTGRERLSRLTDKVALVADGYAFVRSARPDLYGCGSDDQSAVLTEVIRDEGRKYRLLNQDLDDMTQDVWVWLLRVGPPARITRPWIRAVVRNFVLRYRRRAGRIAARELTLPIEVRASEEPDRGGFSAIRMTLDEVSRRLPGRERAVLRLVRRGFSFPEAADRAGIPRGSRQHVRMRLLARLRQELDRPRAPVRPAP